MADLRRNLERQMLMQRVQQDEVLGRIAVSQEEARKYYDAHQSEFTKPQTITLRGDFHSLFRAMAPVNVGIDEEAREKADARFAGGRWPGRVSRSSRPKLSELAVARERRAHRPVQHGRSRRRPQETHRDDEGRGHQRDACVRRPDIES